MLDLQMLNIIVVVWMIWVLCMVLLFVAQYKVSRRMEKMFAQAIQLASGMATVDRLAKKHPSEVPKKAMPKKKKPAGITMRHTV